MPLPCPTPGLSRRRSAASRTVLALAVVVLAVALLPPLVATAQTTVERAEPPEEGTVAVSPDRVGIWFTQPVAAEPTGPIVQIIDSAGNLQSVEPPSIYSLDPRHLNVPLSRALAPGSYSVLWTVQFEDEQVRSGAFGFRVGGSGQPGAAAGLDAIPAAWGLITRFLALFGISLAVAGLLQARQVPSGPGQAAPFPETRPASLAPVGAGLALIATIASPIFAALLTVPAQPVLDVARGYSIGWWLAAVALLVLVVIGITISVRRQPLLPGIVWGAGIALALLALGGTVLPPFGGSLPALAMTIAVTLGLLQVAIVILLGFALAAAIAPAGPGTGTAAANASAGTGPAITGDDSEVAAGRGRKCWALVGLAAITLAVAVVTGSQALSGWADLSARLFGQVLLALGVLLAAALAVGIWRSRRPSSGLGWTIAGLATLSLAAAVVLALLAPPATSITPKSLVAVNIVEPGAGDIGGEPGLIHLMHQPAVTGANAFVVWQATADGTTQPAPRQEVAITLTALDQDGPPVTAEPGVSTGPFSIATANLPDPGWWQAAVTITPEAGEAQTTAFYLLLPDPNVTGYGPAGQSDPVARAVFERALASLTSLQQVQFSMMLGGGTGTFARTEIAISAGDGTTPDRYQEHSPTYETIVIGDQQWFRRNGEPWTERQAASVYLPSAWGETYARATGFTLGPVVETGGEPAQVVSFWLPRQDNPRQEPAWFSWWVGTESGHIHRETMVSTRHYMVYDYQGFNEPIAIEPPTDT